MQYEWEDINYAAEVGESSSKNGLKFALWHTKTLRNTKGLYIPTTKPVARGPNDEPVVSGFVWQDGCVDLLFTTEAVHFCTYEDFVGMGKAFARLCQIAPSKATAQSPIG